MMRDFKEKKCLLGFPHSSGANGHRKIQFEQNKSKVLTIVASIFTFNSYFDLFNILATLIYTYALWQSNTKIYKLLGIIVNGLMIAYNIYIQSILGVILISIAFISSLLGYFKESKNR